MLKLLFSFQGRISRRQYCQVSILIALTMMVISIAIVTATVDGPSHIILWVGGVVFVPSFLTTTLSLTALGVKRAHDLGKRGVCLFNPFLLAELAFSEGETRDNQYGPAIQ